jgi:hypothetical protein
MDCLKALLEKTSSTVKGDPRLRNMHRQSPSALICLYDGGADATHIVQISRGPAPWSNPIRLSVRYEKHILLQTNCTESRSGRLNAHIPAYTMKLSTSEKDRPEAL